MALTVKIIDRTIFGDKRVVFADVTFDASYATGGEALDLKLLGLDQVAFVQSQPTAGYQVEYAAGKLLVKGTGAAAKGAFTELDAATDLSALTIRVMVIGN